MKKLLIVLFTILLLSACGAKEEVIEDKSISVTSPSGAPALALLPHLNNEDVSFDIVEGSDVLQSEFVQGEKDFIIAPVNLGAKLAENTGNYKLLAVLTWGNLHLVSTNENFESGNVAAFGQAAVPGKVLSYLSDELSAYSLDYFEAVNEASAALVSGKYEAAVLAEPYLTMTRSKSEVPLYEIADIQELYKEKSSYVSYPQAALFVKKDKRDVYDDFVKVISEGIAKFNNDSSSLNEAIDSTDISILGFANPELIKNAYTKMALNYVEASECEGEIRSFLNLFGIELNAEIIQK